MSKPLIFLFVLMFFGFGLAVLVFSVLKVRGLSIEKWMSFKREDDVYGELEYLRDNPGWAGQLVVDRWSYWSAPTSTQRARVLFGLSESRAQRSGKVMEEGHWFLSMHMRRKGSIYALEAMKYFEEGLAAGEIEQSEVVKYRMMIEARLKEVDAIVVERQDLRDIQGSIHENLEIVLKQLRAVENS